MSIGEEMKAVKGRIDDLDEQLKKAIAERKEATQSACSSIRMKSKRTYVTITPWTKS